MGKRSPANLLLWHGYISGTAHTCESPEGQRLPEAQGSREDAPPARASPKWIRTGDCCRLRQKDPGAAVKQLLPKSRHQRNCRGASVPRGGQTEGRTKNLGEELRQPGGGATVQTSPLRKEPRLSWERGLPLRVIGHKNENCRKWQ